MQAMKKCWKCGCEKPLEAFGRDARRHDGKNPKCKACVNLASAEYRQANPEKRREICAQYRKNNAEKCQAAYQAWYSKDKEATRAKKREYDAANPEQSRARRAKWRSENRAVIAEIGRSRKSAKGTHTAADIRRLQEMQRGKCAHCAVSLEAAGYHVDHVIPLKLGGTNGADNIQLLCPPCNLSKGAKHPIEFAQEAGRLL